jgi:hypothetical protein
MWGMRARAAESATRDSMRLWNPPRLIDDDVVGHDRDAN